LDKKKMEAAATKKVDQSVDTLNRAKRVYEEWVRTGRKVNANGCPDLGRPSSYAVVKLLLPKIDIKGELRLKDFGTMKKCNAWLGGLGRGMIWDEHMEAAMVE
jgi:hypothetical protein